MKAKDLLKKNETALAIFTNGLNLELDEGGKSISGVWKINDSLDVDKIIIYLRDKEKVANTIFIGDFNKLLPSKVKGLEHRFAVEFINTKSAGETAEN